MPVTINGDGSITGLAVGGLPDGCVDTDTLANGAVTADKSTGSAKGVMTVDQWYLTSSVTSTQDITSGFSRVPLTGAASPLGTGMSESSGVFTFPSTGKWMVIVKAKFSIHDSDSCLLQTKVTTNNSSYTAVCSCNEGLNDSGGGNRDAGSSSFYFLDVTDVSQVKVMFRTESISAGSVLRGEATADTSFIFIRFGDT